MVEGRQSIVCFEQVMPKLIVHLPASDLFRLLCWLAVFFPFLPTVKAFSQRVCHPRIRRPSNQRRPCLRPRSPDGQKVSCLQSIHLPVILMCQRAVLMGAVLRICPGILLDRPGRPKWNERRRWLQLAALCSLSAKEGLQCCTGKNAHFLSEWANKKFGLICISTTKSVFPKCLKSRNSKSECKT